MTQAEKIGHLLSPRLRKIILYLKYQENWHDYITHLLGDHKGKKRDEIFEDAMRSITLLDLKNFYDQIMSGKVRNAGKVTKEEIKIFLNRYDTIK